MKKYNPSFKSNEISTGFSQRDGGSRTKSDEQIDDSQTDSIEEVDESQYEYYHSCSDANGNNYCGDPYGPG